MNFSSFCSNRWVPVFLPALVAILFLLSYPETLAKSYYERLEENMSTDRSRTICSIDTGYCADTVEWCPCQDFESYLVCGTYQLIEENGQENDDTASSCASDESIARGSMRVGNVQLYYLDETLGRFGEWILALILKILLLVVCVFQTSVKSHGTFGC